jgi:membrane-associated protease RseP (regulator of RpoE activity)
LKREGILFLYRTQWGIKLIHRLGDKHKKAFKVLDWFSIISGYILMIIGIWFVWQLVDLYIIQVIITGTTPLKVFPLLPVIPYTPELFKLSFLPPFYFTYWILSLAIIAIGHEFSHGIFAKARGISIKSTGFGFLGPFIAAFVEPNEKHLQKKSIKDQISVLSAGTFANVIMTIVFFLIFILFFFICFVPGGFIFNNYDYSLVPIKNITSFGNFSNSLGNFTVISVGNASYFTIKNISIIQNLTYAAAYDNTSAFREGLSGAILRINNVKITSQEDLQLFLQKTKPGESVTILSAISRSENETKIITLSANPKNSSIGYLGIYYVKAPPSGIISRVVSWFGSFIDPSAYYSPKFDGNFIIFIKDLFFWIIMLNLSVAIINMIPLGIFDGGRVFYLTMLSIFKSEKVAKKIFGIVTYLILAIVLAMVILWFFAVK